MNKIKLKKALAKKTGCTIQSDGWPCGTCFMHMSPELNNSDWQNNLLIRGDYKESELNNLPKDREASYDKIMKICSETYKETAKRLGILRWDHEHTR